MLVNPFIVQFHCTVNPLSVFDVYIRPKTIAACTGDSASYSENFEKPLDRGENLLQNGIQHFAIRLSQSPAIAF